MPSFILRNIDPKLWEKVKARAAESDPPKPLRWLILKMLENYAANREQLKSNDPR